MTELAESSRLDGVRVLLVDDDADTRDLVERVLNRRGARVVAVPSAHDALRTFDQEAFDVLLVDVMMPGMDGFTLMRRIRALPPEKGGSVPAATLTARAVVDDRLESLRAGFQRHLAKPVEPAELVETIAGLVGK